MRTFFTALLVLTSSLLFPGCGEETNPDGTPSACGGAVFPALDDGGCEITLQDPAHCEEIDLSSGRSYAFGWRTNLGCATPYRLHIAGSDADANTGDNIQSWSLSALSGGTISASGGFFEITAADLLYLEAKDGIFHWTVTNSSGDSRPASRAFRVRK